MLIIVVIVLGVALIASLVANALFYKAADRQLERADLYEQMYQDFVLEMKDITLQTYTQMKQLDDVNGHEGVFSKDDEVGIAFKQILSLLQTLNEVTQEE